MPGPQLNSDRALAIALESKSAKIVDPLPLILTPGLNVRNRAAIFLSWGYCLKTTDSKSFALSALAATRARSSPTPARKPGNY